ncbi:hypothetical protein AAZX31_11G112100 [Glycine max]|uniref:Uncharacterized protein n=2 Tax=Glycine subgen. Soja TaxID=1462606 RepID=I1LJA1_SOYBN|nr:uncharacterized protein LOC100784194 [Glycine max]XP_028191663.1 uncharacterized protein LOC114377383 [Glycine soja]KAG4993970.1 hypothetical protein JHK86_030797 [Glycine max]KAG5123962.1 hypothetical protein JHK82_030699 [Glycine max]KAG5145377.1 hypothetical protein JHK84_030920 [Glycine max]KAH1158666.1 hypothetical protein GYH30_030731 [Glycine max]KAH1224526.1 hypothetical protein GmHk_11G031679 [Glycine max]|eukprot:XP_003537857.1 uncharacterized protein LOC100784194 [Glycine max]
MACLQPPWFSSLRVVSPAKLAAGPPPSTTYKPAKLLFWAVGPDNAESSEPASPDAPEPAAPVDPVELAFSKANAYKADYNNDENSAEERNVGDETPKDLPDSVKIAIEKAKKYKQNKAVAAVTETTQGSLGVSERSSGKNKVGKKGELSVSRMDFAGLDFADKKMTRGLPPGLVPISEPYFDGDLPEVELIIGDTSKFDDATTPEPEQTNKEDEAELYKPKVSTWGVFPRPGNISKTFGGGRVIRPGEVLETKEEKAVKEARTKQLLAAYKKKTGLNVDPKLKSECEEALKDGDLLMNVGKLKEALPYYEKVMDKLTFQSELHGLAALQWSICQDSLSRSNEARGMYEKLKSHPNPKVSKKARQFMYSFQAMEMMKMTTGSQFYLKNSDYQNYFDAFVENKSNYPGGDGPVQESAMNQVLPYILFLVSPIFVVLLIAVRKGI